VNNVNEKMYEGEETRERDSMNGSMSENEWEGEKTLSVVRELCESKMHSEIIS